jgi:hypothetical protein
MPIRWNYGALVQKLAKITYIVSACIVKEEAR